MTERWEYMFVEWVATTRQEKVNLVLRQTFKAELKITPRTGEEEVRLAHDSKDQNAETTTLLEVLNELGAAGWELISEVVAESVVGPKSGWEEVGTPIRTRYLLKRRANPSHHGL